MKVVKYGDAGGLLVLKRLRTDKECAICGRLLPSGEEVQVYQQPSVRRRMYYRDVAYYCKEHNITQLRIEDGKLPYGYEEEWEIEHFEPVGGFYMQERPLRRILRRIMR